MKKLLAIVLICLIGLTGCGEDVDGAGTQTNVRPRFSRVGASSWFEDYYYLVDQRTGVVYLIYGLGKGGGITVVLNADGTPMTKDQFEMK